ncbi:hypothetical protein D043_3488A, partial [Vibrio parahaemolyticus EKP-021]
MALCSLEFVIT